MQKKAFNIENLSSHLFWDVDPCKLKPETNKNLIIGRVLDYGLINDWQYIKDYYGIKVIAEVAKDLKELDPKSLTYISLLSDIPIEHFKCYTTTQLQTKHWNF